MKSLSKFILLYICFTVEIRIHATEVPSQCLKNKIYPCAQELSPGEKSANYRSFNKSLIIHLSDKQIQIVRGKISCEGSCNIITPVAKLSLPKGRLTIDRLGQNLELKVFQGTVDVLRRGLKKSDQIPEGFEAHIGPMVDGVAQIDLPAAFMAESYKTAQDQSVTLMRDSVLREMASEESNKKIIQIQNQKRIKEEAHFKKLFRQRNEIE